MERHGTPSDQIKPAPRLTPLTLKGSNILCDEELEVGAEGLQQVLDVPIHRSLVLLLHLSRAASRIAA